MGQKCSRRHMEGGGKQSRLLGRLLGRLRGEHRERVSNLEKQCSFSSVIISENMTIEEDEMDIPMAPVMDIPIAPVSARTSSSHIGLQLTANIDQRYGGQYLTPEELPEFCDQLHNLVQVIRNIQSYAKVTGEYPRTMEQRLQHEADEVAVLAAEARNACDVVARTRLQRRAVRAQRKNLVTHLATLRETEIRELESTVRLSDRKMFKNWEALKESTNPDFGPLLEEVKNKQIALDCLLRLIDGRRKAMKGNNTATPLQPLPPPLPRDNNNEADMTAGASSNQYNAHRREGGRRSGLKRRRMESVREPRSVPLSGEPSHHDPQPQVTLFIQSAENTSRYRVGSAGAVAVTPLELPSNGSVRDIMFFTSN